jgi:hypothetical protein
MEIPINYWAVLVAALVNMFVGTMWYGPVFGKMWRKLMNFNDETMKNMALTGSQAMVGGFITAVLTSYVLSYVAFVFGAVDAMDALILAFWLWLGFFMTNSAGVFLWEGKSFKLFALNTLQHLVSLSLMALVLVLWR